MTVAASEQSALITLTPTAASRLLAIMNEKGMNDTHALRVFVAGGGCSGFQYGMTFDEHALDNDVAFEQHGLRVLVDERSAPYLAGASIDYEDSLMGGGFQIENPNAVATCGCGHSFRTKDQEEGDEGGCSSCH